MMNRLKFKRILILSGILLILFRLAVFSQTTEVFHGTHQRNETFPAVFQFSAIEKDGVTVAVAENIGENSAILAELSDRVQSDAERFRSKLIGLIFHDISVFVVSAGDREPVRSWESALYCSAENIRSGAYRADFLSALLRLDSRWLGIGLLDWIDDVGMAEEAVPIWLEENPERLNLWDGRFLTKLNRPEEIESAVRIAARLVRELIADRGVSSVQDLPPDLRGEFCERMGLPVCLSPETEARLNSFHVKTLAADLVEITTPEIRYVINLNDGYFKDAAELERFLIRGESGIKAVLSALKADLSPENAAWIAENLAGASCRIEYDSLRSATGPSDKEITISRPAGFQRELTQLMIQARKKPYIAIYEGIGVYFDLALFPESFFSDWIFYPPSDQTVEPATALDPDAKACLSGESCSKSARKEAIRRLFGAIRNASRSENEAVRGALYALNQPLRAIKLYENVNEPGIELTFIESAAAVAELIDQFGLDRMMDYLRKGQPFEEAFGTTFESFLEGIETPEPVGS